MKREAALYALVRQIIAGGGSFGFGWRVKDEAERRGMITWDTNKQRYVAVLR